jgi:ATP-dependent helicase HepA
VTRRQKVDTLRRSLSSGAALAAVLRPDDVDLRSRAHALDAADARLAWLAAQAPRWKAAGEKTLIFVAYRETLEMVRAELGRRAQLATGVFHEDLSAARRDTEVARFREPDGPSLLVSTEAGGEGRNFEFCRRMVLFDLPWAPAVVEQRVGRLDRIGRRVSVDVIYFRPPAGIGADAARVIERIGVFREPLTGFEPQLARIEEALAAVAVDPTATLTDADIDGLLHAAFAARTRIQEAAYHELHRHPYRADMADAILARVPRSLDALVERAVVNASLRLGFRAEHLRGRSTFAIEFGNEAIVDSLPGVPGGAAFVGTFDREEAVADESIDFFASGHALVEGLLAHYEDGAHGRVARLQLRAGSERADGVVGFYRDRADLRVVAIDADGRERDDWAAALRSGRVGNEPLEAAVRRMTDADWNRRDWSPLIQRLATRQQGTKQPECVAALAVRP